MCLFGYQDEDIENSSDDETVIETGQSTADEYNNFHETADKTTSSSRDTTATNMQVEQPTPSAPPIAKKFRGGPKPNSTETALRSAQSVLSIVKKRLEVEPNVVPKPNSTRLFCDMLYEQLMTISDVDEREMIQYELHGIMMQRKRQMRGPPLVNWQQCATYDYTPYGSQSRHTSDYNGTASSPTDSCSLSSAVSTAYQSIYYD